MSRVPAAASFSRIPSISALRRFLLSKSDRREEGVTMRRFLNLLLRSLFPGPVPPESKTPTIHRRRAELALLSDDELKAAGRCATDLLEVIAVTAAVAVRVLGL